MGRKKNSDILNQDIEETKEETKEVVEINKTKHINISVNGSENAPMTENVLEETKEVIEQEVHIEKISNEDETPDEIIIPEEVPEQIIEQILKYYPKKDKIEEKPTRTLKSLSKSELRLYQRTGIMPK